MTPSDHNPPIDQAADSPNGGLEFPCQYPVKAMGKSDESFQRTVIEIVSEHVSVDENLIRSRSSKGGNYRSVTVTIDVESRAQLERIYQALRAHREVLWTL